LTPTDVKLADGGRAFDCSACCLPLKPPILQVRHLPSQLYIWNSRLFTLDRTLAV
jgi:hypothetical protein